MRRLVFCNARRKVEIADWIKCFGMCGSVEDCCVFEIHGEGGSGRDSIDTEIYRFWCQSSVAVPVVFAGFGCGGGAWQTFGSGLLSSIKHSN